MPPLSARWRATLLLTLGGAINYGDRAAMASVLPALRSDLRLSDLALGMVGSVFLWSYAAGSPFAGRIADRFPRRNIAICSLAAWSLVMALIGLVPGVASLMALRIALGLAECLYVPAAVALIADHHPPATLARGMSTLIAGMSVGVAVGGTVAGYVARDYGWRPVFWLLGGAGLVLAAIAQSALPEAPSVRTPAAEPTGAREALAFLMRNRTYQALLAKEVLTGVGVWIFFAWMPLYFHDAFKMDLGSAGFAGSFLPEFSKLIGLAAGAWTSDFVMTRFGRRRMLLLGLSYAAGAPFLLLFAGHPGLHLVAAALISFGFLRGFGDSNEHSITCEVVPPQFRATAVGIMNTGASVAGGLGVLVAGLLMSHIGLGAVFAATAILISVMAAGLLIGYVYFYERDFARAHGGDPVFSPTAAATGDAVARD